MNCPHCLSEVSDQAVFCGACGARLAAHEKKSKRPVGQILFGITFVMLGLVAYFLNPLLTQSAVMESLKIDGVLTVSVLSILYHAFSLAVSVFYFGSTVITVVVGVALLCGKSGSGKLALISGIANGVAAAVSLLVTAAVYLLPGTVLSLYAPQAEALKLIKDLLYNSTAMQPFLTVLFLRVSLCALLAAGGIVAFFVLRRHGVPGEKMDRGTAAVIVSVPLLWLFKTVSNLVLNVQLGSWWGDNVLVGYGMASSAIPGVVLVLLFVAITVYALCTSKWKSPVRVLPAVGLAVAVMLVVYLNSMHLLKKYYIPDEAVVYARNALAILNIGTALMFVGYAFWVCAAAKGAIPVWLQLIACLALLVIYVIMMIFAAMVIRAELPLASLFTAGAMVVLAVVANRLAASREVRCV